MGLGKQRTIRGVATSGTASQKTEPAWSGEGDSDPTADQALVRACLMGDKGAWTTLINRYERLIYSIPLRYGFSESQAADIFQEVCLILLEKLDHLRDEARLSAWICTITRRECWRVSRQRDGADRDDPDPLLAIQPAHEATPDDVMADWEAREAMQAALHELDERSRTLLQRLYFTHPTPSYDAIAAELGIPVGSIGPTRARSLKKLYHAMGGQHYRVVS